MENEITNTTIKLTGFNVFIKKSLTWGESEEMKALLFTGFKTKDGGFDPAVMLESKYKLLGMLITKIEKLGDNDSVKEELTFTKEWAYNLSIEDGNKLYDAVDEISAKKKDQK